MRHDDPSTSPRPSSTDVLRPPSRARSWAWPAVLVVLMVSTSLALAVMVSAWLVPAYLVLMVWILAPARDPHDSVVRASSEAGSIPLATEASDSAPSEVQVATRSDAEPGALAASAMAEGPTDQAAVPDPDPETVTVKTRRGKGRGRKAAAAKGSASVEPAATTATWIRVGPGRFVRADGPIASPPVADECESGASESERSPEPELHHDPTPVDDDGAREQAATTPDEGDAAIVECDAAPAAVTTEEGPPEAPALEEPVSGPDDASRDKGIALDAFDVAAAGPADPRPEGPEPVPTPPAATAGSPPQRWAHDATFVSWRAAWPRVGRTARVRPAASFSCSAGRAVRSGGRARVSPGSRRRPRRGSGRYRQVCRAFPPRSPPRAVPDLARQCS